MSSRRAAFYFVFFLLAAAAVELVSFGAGIVLQRKGVFYDPQSSDGFAEYVAIRDPVLGWPSPTSFGTGELDGSGSRVTPAFPDPGEACVSLYGDSFAYGQDVSVREAWANRLSELLGCRVANYGTRGYGTDQAMLRFELNRSDEAPTVILSHLSENVLRNVNRLRALIYPGTRFGLKPRFVPGPEEGLRLIPIWQGDGEQFARMVEQPEIELQHEYFVPGGDSGVTRLGFPYTFSMLSALQHFHVRASLRDEPWYARFYRPDHPSEGLEVTARIIARFDRTARVRGKRPLCVLMPTGPDLMHFRREGEWVYAPLAGRLAELGIRPLDLGPAIVEAIGAGDPCELFAQCDGHLNERGNELIAELVAIGLRDRDSPRR